RLDGRVRGLRLRGEVVCVLPRDRVGLQQVLVAPGRALPIAGVRLGGGEVCPRLQQLLIDLGRADDGEKLALPHVRTDVEVPVAEIAIGARVDGRVFAGKDIA